MSKKQQTDTNTLESRYDELREKTYALGDLAIGTIQMRTNKCGRRGCKCEGGEKHGPKAYLAFSSKREGKMISIYLPKDEVQEIRKRLENLQKFRSELEELLVTELRIRQKKK